MNLLLSRVFSVKNLRAMGDNNRQQQLGEVTASTQNLPIDAFGVRAPLPGAEIPSRTPSAYNYRQTNAPPAVSTHVSLLPNLEIQDNDLGSHMWTSGFNPAYWAAQQQALYRGAETFDQLVGSTSAHNLNSVTSGYPNQQFESIVSELTATAPRTTPARKPRKKASIKADLTVKQSEESASVVISTAPANETSPGRQTLKVEDSLLQILLPETAEAGSAISATSVTPKKVRRSRKQSPQKTPTDAPMPQAADLTPTHKTENPEQPAESAPEQMAVKPPASKSRRKKSKKPTPPKNNNDSEMLLNNSIPISTDSIQASHRNRKPELDVIIDEAATTAEINLRQSTHQFLKFEDESLPLPMIGLTSEDVLPVVHDPVFPKAAEDYGHTMAEEIFNEAQFMFDSYVHSCPDFQRIMPKENDTSIDIFNAIFGENEADPFKTFFNLTPELRSTKSVSRKSKTTSSRQSGKTVSRAKSSVTTTTQATSSLIVNSPNPGTFSTLHDKPLELPADINQIEPVLVNMNAQVLATNTSSISPRQSQKQDIAKAESAMSIDLSSIVRDSNQQHPQASETNSPDMGDDTHSQQEKNLTSLKSDDANYKNDPADPNATGTKNTDQCDTAASNSRLKKTIKSGVKKQRSSANGPTQPDPIGKPSQRRTFVDRSRNQSQTADLLASIGYDGRRMSMAHLSNQDLLAQPGIPANLGWQPEADPSLADGVFKWPSRQAYDHAFANSMAFANNMGMYANQTPGDPSSAPIVGLDGKPIPQNPSYYGLNKNASARTSTEAIASTQNTVDPATRNSSSESGGSTPRVGPTDKIDSTSTFATHPGKQYNVPNLYRNPFWMLNPLQQPPTPYFRAQHPSPQNADHIRQGNPSSYGSLPNDATPSEQTEASHQKQGTGNSSSNSTTNKSNDNTNNTANSANGNSGSNANNNSHINTTASNTIASSETSHSILESTKSNPLKPASAPALGETTASNSGQPSGASKAPGQSARGSNTPQHPNAAMDFMMLIMEQQQNYANTNAAKYRGYLPGAPGGIPVQPPNVAGNYGAGGPMMPPGGAGGQIPIPNAPFYNHGHHMPGVDIQQHRYVAGARPGHGAGAIGMIQRGHGPGGFLPGYQPYEKGSRKGKKGQSHQSQSQAKQHQSSQQHQQHSHYPHHDFLQQQIQMYQHQQQQQQQQAMRYYHLQQQQQHQQHQQQQQQRQHTPTPSLPSAHLSADPLSAAASSGNMWGNHAIPHPHPSPPSFAAQSPPVVTHGTRATPRTPSSPSQGHHMGVPSQMAPPYQRKTSPSRE
ncbi:hypothetical protein HDU76_001800 [Blyttiomyces sp. JEL0837]|nr:hypothetical protein HDU76_001800 [Blyttiomyces sp. JEL0837]